MEGCGNRVSCRNLFKKLQILPLNIFNNLPLEIENVAGNPKKLKIALKKFLYTY
jgi:hypothetical protein